MSDDFLSRWSRRKRAAQRSDLQRGPDERRPETSDAPASAQAPASIEKAENAAPPEAELGEEDIARLPSLDQLTADSDISVFLRKGVPESLRNAALRRMWSLDPKIRDFVSEAREYAYDWNTPGGVPGFGGPLPPPEEIQKMAARIVGALTEPRDDVADEGNAQASHSRSGERPGVEPASVTTDAPQAHAAALPPAPLATDSPLDSVRLDSPRKTVGGIAGSHGDAATQQERREQQEKPSRPRHGGAMPV